MNGSSIAKHAWMSSFGMMVWVILWFKKGVGHVKEAAMHVGSVLTVTMGVVAMPEMHRHCA